MVSKVEKAAKEFESRSRAIYGDVLDYSQVVYQKSLIPVKLGCKVCGTWFEQRPNTLFNKKKGKGCPVCSIENRNKNSRKSQEDFVKDAKGVHGEFYDYSLSEYLGAKIKVKIICPVHGVFEQAPSGHLNGQGCRKCMDEKTGNRCRSTLEDFLLQSHMAHGDRYDYSEVAYTNMHKKVKIGCKIHGAFWQKPNHHYTGVGCPLCGKEATALKLSKGKEDFIRDALEVHGEKYDYSDVQYKNSSSKVVVNCLQHGPWSTSPANHLCGSGCPACGMRDTGFSTNKIATLYVLEYGEETKVGITNRPINKRLREICSDSQKSFSLLKQYSELDGGLCFSLESRILKELKIKYKQAEGSYSGVTECFMNVDRAWLLNTIEAEVHSAY